MSENGKTVGVLGGMGPDATIDFMTKVVALTPAEKDQDHVHMLIDHNPAVPDRQTAILANGEDPGPFLAAMASRLEVAGADFLVIPCNTAYVFKDSIEEATSIPLVSIIDLTVAEVLEHGANAAGVLTTNGCLKAGVFQDGLSRANVKSILPDDDELEKFMELTYHIKAGYQGESVSHDMATLAEALVARGADVIVAGCTEIPLVLRPSNLKVPLISSTDILAKQTVAYARGEIPLPAKE